MVLNYKKFNPNAFLLLKYVLDTTVRFIILYGGSSSGKTFSVAQIILILTLWEGSNTLVLRKVATSIKDTVYQSFKAAAESLGIYSHFKFVDSLKVITCLDNGAKIVFKGLDDEEKIKGLESFKRVVMEELNEFEERDHKQIRKRLRGMEGQQIVHMFNPVDEGCWIKKKLFDTQNWHEVPMEVEIAGTKLSKELVTVKSLRMNEGRTVLNPRTKEPENRPPNTVVIQSTYLNNFWIVGSPDGTYGFYDEQCVADFEYDRLHDPDYYNVYALAEWGVIRTGSEFFGSFNRGIHSMSVSYDPELPIHISVDNNVLPYISFTFWQIHIGERTVIRQIDEVCAESPNNTVRKAAKLVACRLRGYDRLRNWRIFLHGDASTRAANSIDDEKRSWLDLLIDALAKEDIEVIDCVGNKNPSVPMSGEFINAIYEGAFEDIGIEIGENCKISIEDYMSVQKDVNGAILKTKVKNKITGQTYEEHGHLSDTKRYLVCDVLKAEFISFSNRRKYNIYAGDGMIRFYNPDTQHTYSEDFAYCMPDINGRFVLIRGKKCGQSWHIVGIRFMEAKSTEEMKDALSESVKGMVILECSKSYYVMARELRESMDSDLRVIHESGDLPRRIAATADFVKNRILFSKTAIDCDAEYGEFIANMLDYNRDSKDNIEASAVLSGFIQAVLKLGL